MRRNAKKAGARSWRRGRARMKELLDELRAETEFDSFELTRDEQDAISAKILALEAFIDETYGKREEAHGRKR